MRCFECGGQVIQTVGSVRMTREDGTLIIFKDCAYIQGENYVRRKLVR